jgi:hypothetical protein
MISIALSTSPTVKFHPPPVTVTPDHAALAHADAAAHDKRTAERIHATLL